MSVFSDAELAFLGDGKKLGRLATMSSTGYPHVTPLGWSYNEATDTIDIGGRDFAKTKKFRNVKANPKVAFIVDDVLPPWQPRCVTIQGDAEALDEATDASGTSIGPIIRIRPTKVMSWGV
jgi:pyridoxamine 5'-phosphate oxidase family protein